MPLVKRWETDHKPLATVFGEWWECERLVIMLLLKWIAYQATLAGVYCILDSSRADQ
jgi:hypothetical protein